MLTPKQSHIHKFLPTKSLKVILHKYENHEGKPQDIALTGYDILKQHKCECGKIETYDLERVDI